MSNRLLSEKVYKLSETETLTLTDTWDADVQRVWIKAVIRNITMILANLHAYKVTLKDKPKGYQ